MVGDEDTCGVEEFPYDHVEDCLSSPDAVRREVRSVSSICNLGAEAFVSCRVESLRWMT